METNAKVILHSVSEEGKQIVTFELTYPRFIHGEVMTHRVFSRNAMSSRAIPVAKMIEQVRTNPAMPVHWGANQSGMQAHAEVEDKARAVMLWAEAAKSACEYAEKLVFLGLHKQIANRILEPFQWMRTIVSGITSLSCVPTLTHNLNSKTLLTKCRRYWRTQSLCCVSLESGTYLI